MLKKLVTPLLLSILISKVSHGMDIVSPTPLEIVFRSTPDVGKLILSEAEICMKTVYLASKIFHPIIAQMIVEGKDKKLEDLLFFSRLPGCADHLRRTSFSLDIFYDSREKELTDHLLGKVLEAFPNLSSLRLNIIYLSEKGLRQLTRLSQLKTLILDCSYTDALKSLRWEAGEEFRLRYYPERLKLCRDVLDDFKEEIETWENQDHKKFLIGDLNDSLETFKKVLKELRRCNKYKDSHKKRVGVCKEIIDILAMQSRSLDDQNKNVIEGIIQNALEKLSHLTEGENQNPGSPLETFMQDLANQLAELGDTLKLGNPFERYQVYKKHQEKNRRISDLLNEEERQDKNFVTTEDVELYITQLRDKVFAIQGKFFLNEFYWDPLFTYKAMLPSRMDQAYRSLNDALLSCDFPGEFRRERWETKQERMKNQENWLKALPHDCATYHLEGVTKSCLKEFGNDFWNDKKDLVEQYWKKVRQSLEARYPGAYSPDIMKKEFPFPITADFSRSGNGVYRLEYPTLFWIYRDMEVKKYASLEFGYVLGDPKLCHQSHLDHYIHFYEVVQDSQTLESYDSLWNQLKMSEEKIYPWEQKAEKAIEGPYQPNFRSCVDFREDRTKKQQKILASCIDDILISNPGLKHLKVPALENTEMFRGTSRFPTYWSMKFKPKTGLQELPVMDAFDHHSQDGLRQFLLNSEQNCTEFMQDHERSRIDEKTFQFFLTKSYDPNWEGDSAEVSAPPVLPFVKKLDVLEFTHPYATEHLFPPETEADSSLTISIPKDKLGGYLNFMEGLIEKTEYIGKLIFNQSFDLEAQKMRKKHGLEIYQTRIPKNLIRVIEDLKAQGRIGTYEIITTDQSSL